MGFFKAKATKLQQHLQVLRALPEGLLAHVVDVHSTHPQGQAVVIDQQPWTWEMQRLIFRKLQHTGQSLVMPFFLLVLHSGVLGEIPNPLFCLYLYLGLFSQLTKNIWKGT